MANQSITFAATGLPVANAFIHAADVNVTLNALIADYNLSIGMNKIAGPVTVATGGTGITTVAPAIIVDTDGGTVTFDMTTKALHQVTLAGNRTLAVTNVTAGQTFMLKLIQDGTGSRTVTWFSTILWPGGTVPTLTTGPNKADWFGFVAKTSSTFDGFIIGQNL